MSLCFKIEHARLAYLAELHVRAVIKAFLNFLVRNVRDAEEHISEFLFCLAYFSIELLDAVGELLHLHEESRYILAFLFQLRHFARSDVLLVLDSTTGQNAFQQAKEFSRATDVTSLAVTKLDGSAKGGVVIGIVDQFHIPIKFIGIGEGIDDLKVFSKKEFVSSLFSLEDFKQ